jgi:speckle-type POZ protein
VDTISVALACVEIYSCPELMSKCINFIVAEKNFTNAVLGHDSARYMDVYRT